MTTEEAEQAHQHAALGLVFARELNPYFTTPEETPPHGPSHEQATTLGSSTSGGPAIRARFNIDTDNTQKLPTHDAGY